MVLVMILWSLLLHLFCWAADIISVVFHKLCYCLRCLSSCSHWSTTPMQIPFLTKSLFLTIITFSHFPSKLLLLRSWSPSRPSFSSVWCFCWPHNSDLLQHSSYLPRTYPTIGIWAESSGFNIMLWNTQPSPNTGHSSWTQVFQKKAYKKNFVVSNLHIPLMEDLAKIKSNHSFWKNLLCIITRYINIHYNHKNEWERREWGGPNLISMNLYWLTALKNYPVEIVCMIKCSNDL